MTETASSKLVNVLGARLLALQRPVLPIVLALIIGGIVLAALGRDPLQFYGNVLRRTIFSPSGLQEVLVMMAPLLMLAASLIVCFRAGLWNLGIDGQYLLGGLFVAAYGPAWVEAMPFGLAMVLLFGLAIAVGALWAMVPALLRAYEGVNEIISTLMMTFLALSTGAFLVKTVFGDPDSPVPQTVLLSIEHRLPRVGDTLIHIGVIIAFVAVIVVHFFVTRTSFGLKLQMIGHNPRAAEHCGLDVPRLTIAVFAISAALAAVGGAIDVLGVRGIVRADWHPAHGLLVVPLVFLARFNGIAVIAFVAFFAVLIIGGESASRRADLPHDFLLILMALILVILALTDELAARFRQRT
jgi:general nucleoside transport system permease protein